MRSVCQKKSVCVVEAEKTAVILSEVYPEYVWLAAGGLGEVQTEKFRPLRGHKVVLFPDTDSDGIAFRRWSEAATLVMNQVFWEDSPPIRVSPLLETHATPEQKAAKIDLRVSRFTELPFFSRVSPMSIRTLDEGKKEAVESLSE